MFTTWVDISATSLHFVKIRTTGKTVEMTNKLLGNIFRHHVLPDNIVSDRGSKMTSEFSKRLMELCGVQLKM